MTLAHGGQNLSASHRYGRADPAWVQNLHHFIHGLPKAELHVHMEGTLTPWHIVKLAKRNGIAGLPTDIKGVQRMLAGSVLSQFLKGLAKARSVLVTEQDFFEVTFDFALQQLRHNVVYTELLFDPQGHTERGVAFDTVMHGLVRACQAAREQLGIRIELVMQLHRDKSRESAFATLKEAARWRHVIRGVGMDNGPQQGYAEKLQPVMEAARAMGLELAGHVDRYELDHAHNLDFLLNVLKVGRIDHGINIIDSPQLMPVACERGVTFTVCGATLYTDDLQVYEDSGFKLYTRRFREMTEAGLNTTINTDDPGIFIDFYLGDMLKAFALENGLTREDLLASQRRAFNGAFLPAADKQHYLALLDAYADANP